MDPGKTVQSSTSHEAILNSMNDAVFVVDRDLIIRYTNPAAERLTGYSPDESLGKKCFAVFCERSPRCESDCPLQHAVRDHLPTLHRDATTRTKRGALRQTQISLSPFDDDHWGPAAVLVIKDITDLKTTEEKIVLQNKFLTAVIDALPHPFYVIDPVTYRVILANYAAAQEVMPRHVACYELSHQGSVPCSSDEHPCPMRRVRETGQPVTVEHIHRFADGSLRSVEVHGYPVFDGEGLLVQMIEYCIDISDRKTAAQEREALIGDLQRALNEVKALSGLLPICASCKQIRDDQGNWNTLEQYISSHSEATFSHGICPECAQKLYPDMCRKTKT
jgi:PAS domain S-box-containing protein